MATRATRSSLSNLSTQLRPGMQDLSWCLRRPWTTLDNKGDARFSANLSGDSCAPRGVRKDKKYSRSLCLSKAKTFSRPSGPLLPELILPLIQAGNGPSCHLIGEDIQTQFFLYFVTTVDVLGYAKHSCCRD